MLSLAIDNTNPISPEMATRRLDDLCSVQDGLKMSSDGHAVERRISEGSLRNDAEDAGVTAGETATELCFPNGSVSADERSNPSLISGWSDLVEAGTGQTRAVLPQEPSKADDGRNVEASGGAASVITHSETPAGTLPNPRQADSAGEAIPPTSPAPLSTGATVVSGSAACSAVCATGAHYTRPAPFDGSGDEPSVPSFSDGGAKMLDGCSRPAGRADTASGFSHAQAKQVATYSTWSPWSVCKGSN